jgi:hypothetical protein
MSLAVDNGRPGLYLTPFDLRPESADFTKNISMYLNLGFRWGAVVIMYIPPAFLSPSCELTER